MGDIMQLLKVEILENVAVYLEPCPEMLEA